MTLASPAPLTPEAADVQQRVDLLLAVERDLRERQLRLDEQTAELSRREVELNRRSDEIHDRSKSIGKQQNLIAEREHSVQTERAALRRPDNIVPMQRPGRATPKVLGDYSIGELNALIAAGLQKEVVAMHFAASERRRYGPPSLPSDPRAKALTLLNWRRHGGIDAKQEIWLSDFFQKAEATRELLRGA